MAAVPVGVLAQVLLVVIFRIVKGLSLPDVRGDQPETMLRQNLWRKKSHQDQMPGILGRRRGGVGREGQTRGHRGEGVSISLPVSQGSGVSNLGFNLFVF